MHRTKIKYVIPASEPESIQTRCHDFQKTLFDGFRLGGRNDEVERIWIIFTRYTVNHIRAELISLTSIGKLLYKTAT